MSLSAQGDPDKMSAVPLEPEDRKILTAIQAEFPLSRTPYRDIAARTGLGEEEVLERVRALRERRLIRRIGGVISSKKMGLTGTLVAMKVPRERIDEVAAVVNAFSSVTHNYLREYEYNMWFTVTANSKQEIDDVLSQIKEQTGIVDLLDLPSTRTYKINVRMNFEEPCPTD